MTGIGHNSQRLDAAAQANVETGVLLLCKEFLVTAISDRRLDRTHLRVLACLVDFVNKQSAKAWPDRRTIAQALGIEPVTVSNKLRELRLWGYLIAERERVPEANNRSLTVYTLGNVDHETIRREIQIYIDRIKASTKVTEGGDSQKSPDTVTVTEGGDFGALKVTEYGARKSPSTVDSNSEKELLKKEPLCVVANATPPRSKKGSRLPEDWTLPDEWRRHPRERGLSERQINAVAKKFRNYWLAESGKHAVKLRWDLTWQNWVDKQIDEFGLKPEGGGAGQTREERAAQYLKSHPLGREHVQRDGWDGAMQWYLGGATTGAGVTHAST